MQAGQDTKYKWSEQDPEIEDANYNVKIKIPVPKERHDRADDRDSHRDRADSEPMQSIDPEAIHSAKAFYKSFTSACHGITRRQELDQLYHATYRSLGLNDKVQRPEFSKVLFAMAREMRVLRVIRGGTLSWNALNNQRDDYQDRQDRRPCYDDRRDDRQDRRPRYDDRRDRH